MYLFIWISIFDPLLSWYRFSFIILFSPLSFRCSSCSYSLPLRARAERRGRVGWLWGRSTSSVWGRRSWRYIYIYIWVSVCVYVYACVFEYLSECEWVYVGVWQLACWQLELCAHTTSIVHVHTYIYPHFALPILPYRRAHEYTPNPPTLRSGLLSFWWKHWAWFLDRYVCMYVCMYVCTYIFMYL